MYVPIGSENATEEEADSNESPFDRFTHQTLPAGRPASVIVTAYRTTENVTPNVTLAPLTATCPNRGSAEYPGTAPTWNEYVPFGLSKLIWVPVEPWDVPSRVTDQGVLDGRPLWAKTTLNATT